MILKHFVKHTYGKLSCMGFPIVIANVFSRWLPGLAPANSHYIESNFKYLPSNMIFSLIFRSVDISTYFSVGHVPIHYCHFHSSSPFPFIIAIICQYQLYSFTYQFVASDFASDCLSQTSDVRLPKIEPLQTYLDDININIYMLVSVDLNLLRHASTSL